MDKYPDAIRHLAEVGTLLIGYDGNNWTTKYYYLDRSARKKYDEHWRAQHESTEPEKKEVSSQLQELSRQITESQQAAFLAETVSCLTVDANRAAIVMAWNLTYYHVRSWILEKHEPAFNKEVMSNFKCNSFED